MVRISKKKLKARDPKTILALLYVKTPMKLEKLAATQGYEVKTLEDAEALGDMILKGDAKFSIKRIVSQMKISNKDILQSAGKFVLVD